MKGYYGVDDSLEIISIPWVLYALGKNGKFYYRYGKLFRRLRYSI